MADVVLFHSAYGLRPAILDDAHRLRAAGHQVTTPDLYDGAVFDDLDTGMAEKERIGPAELGRRAELAVRALSPSSNRVFAGWSLGGWYAAAVARDQPAAGLLLFSCELPLDGPDDQAKPAFPVQIHAAHGDAWIEEDEVAEATRRGVEVFRYDGGHLFADPGLPDYDAASAQLLWQRVLGFLQ